MKKVTKLDWRNYYATPNPGLLAYFSHVRLGQDVDIRPPFWKGKSRSQVIEMWNDEISSYHIDDLVPGLMAFEEEMRDKIGPLSIMAPLKERITGIEEYYKDVELASEPIDERAIRAFCDTVRPVKVQRRDWKTTIRDMRLSTNSGAPYFTKRRIIAEAMLENVLPGGYATIPSGPYPATLGWRGQEGGPSIEDVKQRTVWMFPFSVNVQELTMYQPLIIAWKHYHINPAFESNRAVEEKITRLFDTKGDEYVVVTDFSRFDQHFNSDLQRAARQIIHYQIVGASAYDWEDEVFPIKYNIPLICDTDLMYEGDHGMGSGSGGTNFDEDCAHGSMQHEVAIKNGKRLNPNSNAYGDDGYLSYEGIDVDDVISSYTSHGQEMNPDKQWVDKHSMVYLRRYYHDSYRDSKGTMLGIYSTFRALGRLLGQERFIPFKEGSKDYARYVILRAYSIIENCNQHPYFTKFVDFVIKGDKYKLGLALPGFLDSLSSEVKKAMEMDPDLLGYTKTLQLGTKPVDINDWAVVKYLKSKQNSR
uniref:RNA-dependent RNA polymerase n=1 Tax=Rabbit picobirnavirus 3 TaxID=2716677 RepID=A0A6G7PSI2_9VIRU|nr:RNA-dependent RNA polymerase [Rabbit picobirnavirus 3]